MTDINKAYDLAQGLQNSNEPSIAFLAKGFLALFEENEVLRKKVVDTSAKKVFKEHYDLLSRLED